MELLAVHLVWTLALDFINSSIGILYLCFIGLPPIPFAFPIHIVDGAEDIGIHQLILTEHHDKLTDNDDGAPEASHLLEEVDEVEDLSGVLEVGGVKGELDLEDGQFLQVILGNEGLLAFNLGEGDLVGHGVEHQVVEELEVVELHLVVVLLG